MGRLNKAHVVTNRYMMGGMRRRSFIEKAGVLGGTVATAGLSGWLDRDGTGGDAVQNADQQLTFGSVYPSGHVINEMAQEWASDVNEQTDGRVGITIEGAFGGEQEVMEQTSIGAIDGTLIGAMWVIQHDPANFWVESPFVFEDWEQQRRAYRSEFLDDGRQNLREQANQQIVGPPVYRGFRHTTGNRAFETPEDIQNVNIRVPELSAWVNIWQGLGASPTTVAFDELYSALQQGVVDAQENPAQTVLSMSLYEVQDYYTLTRHLASTGWFTINNSSLQSLQESDRQVLTDSLTEHIESLSSDIADSEEEAIQQLQDEHGMEIVEPDREAWLSAAEPVLQSQFEEGDWEPSLEEVRNI